MTDPNQRASIANAAISVVLAAHNNADIVRDVVRAWVRQLERRKRPFEILLVNDGSGDETGTKAEALATQHTSVRVVNHPAHLGLGAALRSGIASAQHPLLCYTMCAREYPPSDLPRFLERIDAVDLVTGYRGGPAMPAWLRGFGAGYRVAVRILLGLPLEPLPTWLGWREERRRWLARWLFGLRVYDLGCAFALARREIFARIPIQSVSRFALVEILAKANFLGCYVDQVPVSYRQEEPDHFVADAFRLLRHADFGPAILPPPAPPDQPASAPPRTDPTIP